MNASSIEVFHQDFLVPKEVSKPKHNNTFGSDSFISAVEKKIRTPTKTKSLHKSYLNKSSIYFPENSQFNSQVAKVSKNLSKVFSESKISCKDSSFFMKKTNFGESMVEKLRKWEQGFEIDEEFHGKLSSCFSDLEHKIQTLETQFFSALSITKRVETQIFENNEMAKGWNFLKISFKNPKKSSNKIVFFSQNLEAICWRDNKNKLPKNKQMIFLKDIRNIYSKPQKNFVGKDMSCFVSIETSQRSLDLVAPNIRIKELFVRLLNQYLKNFKQNFGKDEELLIALSENKDYGFLNDQYNAQIELMRKEVVQTKILFEDVASRLRKNFFETAQLWLKEEKNKGLVLKRHSNKCEEKYKKNLKTLEMVNTQKNKLSRELSETLLKNKHLLKQIKILLDQSNSFSSELMKITEDITQYLKNINKWPEDVEQKQLGNISFNLIDSHYLEFDKMANFSNLNELKKVIDCLIKARKNGLDTGKIMEENELLLKHSQILQFQIEETLMNCQIKDDLIEKIEQKYVQLNFKQNQLKSQVEKLVDQILTSQKNLKEEFLCYSNEKTIMTLEKTNVDLKEKLEEKSIEISNINETFLSQRDFFEKKTKELLNKVAHYEIESYTFLKINANENSSFIKTIQKNENNSEDYSEKMKDYDELKRKLTEKMDFEIVLKKEIEDYKKKITIGGSLQEELTISNEEIDKLKIKLHQKQENEKKLKDEIDLIYTEKNKILMQLEENRKALEDLQLKLKETDENEQQLRIKSEFSLNNMNSIKKLYEENKTTLIELKKNLLIIYFSFMVIISSYQDNKENLNKQNINENSFNYAEKFQTSLKFLFNILSDFFQKSTFKDLENSVKKVFNLVVKTPTEFNKKPLDDLYQKLDKIYNRFNDNDESLSTMRSFYMDGGVVSPKISDLNVSCIKFNH